MAVESSMSMDVQALKSAAPIFWATCLSLCVHLAIVSVLPRLLHDASSSAAPTRRLTVLAVTMVQPLVPASPALRLDHSKRDSSFARERRNKAELAATTKPVAQGESFGVIEQSGQPSHDLPAASAGAAGLIAEAMRNAGRIDRELRHGAPELSQPKPRSLQSTLQKGFAAAARPGNAGMEEVVLPDGRRMTKVVGPSGTYCVMRESAAAIGIDPQRGAQTMVTTCP